MTLVYSFLRKENGLGEKIMNEEIATTTTHITWKHHDIRHAFCAHYTRFRTHYTTLHVHYASARIYTTCMLHAA